MNVLELREVRLKTGAWSLDAAFRLQEPVTGLFGPSGAGKTTILELIAGVRRPDCGLVRIGEQVVFDAALGVCHRPESRSIGYVPQDLALFPHRTVRENLLYGARSAQSVSHRLEHLVDVLDMGRSLMRFPGTLSGGEKQRVALGRALLSGPRLLLLDEPLANLDLSLRRNLLDLFQRITREFGTPMLYVTHDAGELATLGCEVILMDHGRVKGHGPFHHLFTTHSVPSYRLRAPQPPGG